MMTVQQRLRDAVMAAFVGAVLALPLLGFETVDTGGPLGINTRFHLVGYAAVIVFFGRLVFMGLLDWRRNHLTKGQQAEAATGERRDFLTRLGSKADKWLMPALIAFAVILPMMPFADRTVVDLGTVVLIYVMLGWGLNIVVGLAGLLDLGYVAFYAVGAYTYALLRSEEHTSELQSLMRTSYAVF